MIKAVLFDLDGVLVDAVEWHYQAFNRALSLFGYSVDRDEHRALYNGLPTAVKLELLSQRRGFPRALHAFANEMKQRYTREILNASLRPQPHTAVMLQELKSRGYRLGVATNSKRSTLDFFLKGLGIEAYFDIALSQEDVAAPKPSPHIYERCFQGLGLAPSECLVVEDSVPGIQAARLATPHVVIVRSAEEVTLELLLAEIARRKEVEQPTRRTCLEVVIPMAGLGQRFASQGYASPKPFIEIFGKPMIQWVVENVSSSRFPSHFTFLCNAAHLKDHGAEKLLRSIAPGCDIVPVPSLTEGAACTLLLGMERIKPDAPLLVANSDQWLDFSIDEFLQTAFSTACDGLIATFPATDTKWSYARTDSSGHVLEVAEKRPISPHATVGLYYFRCSSDFFEGAQELIRSNLRVNGEFYVCPVYNELIRRKQNIRIFNVGNEAMHGLGTPEDLEAFIRWNLIRARTQGQAYPTLQQV